MPKRLQPSCRVPTCPERATSRGYCDLHQPPQRRGKDRRESAAKRGYDRHYRKLREKLIREHPFCYLCGSEKQLVTHHLTHDAHDDGGGDGLIVLCRRCHEHEHGRG